MRTGVLIKHNLTTNNFTMEMLGVGLLFSGATQEMDTHIALPIYILLAFLCQNADPARNFVLMPICI